MNLTHKAVNTHTVLWFLILELFQLNETKPSRHLKWRKRIFRDVFMYDSIWTSACSSSSGGGLLSEGDGAITARGSGMSSLWFTVRLTNNSFCVQDHVLLLFAGLQTLTVSFRLLCPSQTNHWTSIWKNKRLIKLQKILSLTARQQTQC